jgi:hypothetical protein
MLSINDVFKLRGRRKVLVATAAALAGSPVYIGQAGASKNVNGVDFWVLGTPPRKFRIVGYIVDNRKRGIIESVTHDPNIAAKAKAAGGDAVIATAEFDQRVATV